MQARTSNILRGLLRVLVTFALLAPGAAIAASWVHVDSGTVDDLNGIHGAGEERFIVGGTDGQYVILRESAGSWQLDEQGSGFELRGIWGSGSDEFLAVGGDWDIANDYREASEMLYFDGSSWSPIALAARAPRIIPQPEQNSLHAAWGASPGTPFAVGGKDGDLFQRPRGYIFQFDNPATFSVVAPPDTAILRDVWGSSASNVYAVGYLDVGVGISSYVFHFDGVSWEQAEFYDGGRLHGVWGSSASDVYAVGTNGSILHYDGVAWSTMPSGVTEDLRAVWGSSPTDVYAVGAQGTILHYNGVTWTQMDSGTAARLNDIWGSSETDIQIVGDGGTILSFDGAEPVLVWSFTLNYDWTRTGLWSNTTIDLYSDHIFRSSEGPPPGVWEMRMTPVPGSWGEVQIPAISLKFSGGCKPLYAGTISGYMTCTDGSMQDTLPGYWFIGEPENPRAANEEGPTAASPR
jgi:hypothetical protein